MDESHRATEVGGRECGGILSPGRALLLWTDGMIAEGRRGCAHPVNEIPNLNVTQKLGLGLAEAADSAGHTPP